MSWLRGHACLELDQPIQEQGKSILHDRERILVKGIHPVCCLRFLSDRTQPLDILSTDSEFVCYCLSKKKVPGQPNPWNKSLTANSCYANRVYYLRPISLLRLSLLRSVDSSFPGSSLRAREFHPFELRFCLSQSL